MRKHRRIAITSLVALVALVATMIPANAALSLLFPTRFSQKTIERLAPYVPQTTCDPAAKIGTRSLLALLERRYPGTGSDGISRACNLGGRSEHKEGRALDWAVNYNNPTQRAQAATAINWLLKKDKMGRPFANARRLGVMYIIWNRQIWSARERAWRPYGGASPHRDHVHISLSWAGARAKTSFWTGRAILTPITTPTTAPTATPSTTPTATPTSSIPVDTTESKEVTSTSNTTSSSTTAVASEHDDQETVRSWWWERK